MTKSTDIRARIEPDRKAAGREILDQLGISESEYLNLCWSQLILRKGVPFDVRLPETGQAKDNAGRESNGNV
jgi:addiction module RelB/DinJ family antitoxin